MASSVFVLCGKAGFVAVDVVLGILGVPEVTAHR